MPVARSLLLALVLGLSLSPSLAQDWPQRTVRIVTPLGPGSGMDLAARTFAEKLSQRWGQPVVVENRQGADGIPAVQTMMADRDNHSLIFGFAGLVSINPIIHDKLPYDPARDIVPVAAAVDTTLALMVSTSLNIDSMKDFVALAKSRPGQLNWAATTGLPLYIVAALQKSTGVDITQISYRDFGPAFQDFATGRVHLLATGISILMPQLAAGRGKFVMIPGSVRSPLTPEVPTAREAGFPELTFDSTVGLYGWRDMPQATKDRIAADVRVVAADPSVAERLRPVGVTPRAGTGAEFAAAIEEQRGKVAAVAEMLKAKAK